MRRTYNRIICGAEAHVKNASFLEGGGFAEGKDGGVVANDFSKLYVRRVAMEFVETITYYPSVSYADISPRKGRLVIKTPLLHIILYFKLTDKPEFTI